MFLANLKNLLSEEFLILSHFDIYTFFCIFRRIYIQKIRMRRIKYDGAKSPNLLPGITVPADDRIVVHFPRQKSSLLLSPAVYQPPPR